MCALITKVDIVENWLPRYPGVPLDKFGKYVLLTNFQRYVDLFAKAHKVPVHGREKPMPTATSTTTPTMSVIDQRWCWLDVSARIPMISPPTWFAHG